MILILSLLFSFSARAADFTYDDLKLLIESQGIMSLEDLLPNLPQEMRSNYVLMHHSRSLQEASYTHPRAILFGRNGKLTCSFNGESSQYGYDSLECFQFRDQEKKFDFRQIQFPSPENGLKAVEFSASNQTVNKSISCTACHSEDPRPNWNHYNLWPGAYGEEDDRIEFEADNYRKFRNIRDFHPRYQWLIQESNSYAPYRLNLQEVETAHRPNFRLTDIYGRLNALRAARIVTDTLPKWEVWAYVMSALHCKLTPEQKTEFKNAGLDPAKDLQMSKIFADIGMESYDWSTQIAGDPQNYPGMPWEHQSGFSMFSESVAMALVQEKAKNGNAEFAAALSKILDYYTQHYSGDELRFNKTLNEIVPSPDFFGPGYNRNREYVCPEAIRLLLEEYRERR